MLPRDAKPVLESLAFNECLRLLEVASVSPPVLPVEAAAALDPALDDSSDALPVRDCGLLLGTDRFVGAPRVAPLVVSPALETPVPLPIGSPLSADATPLPEAITAPIPSATANPPTRPTYADAFMRSYLHDPSRAHVRITGVDSIRVRCENWNRTPFELIAVVILKPVETNSDHGDIGSPPKGVAAPANSDHTPQINGDAAPLSPPPGAILGADPPRGGSAMP